MSSPGDTSPDFDFDTSATGCATNERFIDPVLEAAEVLVRRTLDAQPQLKEALSFGGVAVVVEVPSASWVTPVRKVWGHLVWPSKDEDLDGDCITRPFWWHPDDRPDWVVFSRDGSEKCHRPDSGNDGVSAALSAGRPVVGISPSPERYLPRDLIRVADVRFALMPLDAEALTEIVTTLTGTAPSLMLPESLYRLIALEDLRLAWRPQKDADGYVTRLRRLLERKASAPGLTLEQMHGMDEAVAWGKALARDLGDYRRGVLSWSAVDRGVLLFGPPGTGKTTFARALAGSCGVPLICGSLGQWQAAGHLGDLLKAMRQTFDQARASAPSILFIDEIDAFGDRATFTHEYREYSIQVVNGLLEELDGAGGREGVVVVGACNNPRRLDPAITRSGRLDRTIGIAPPDQKALVRILRHHLGSDLADADLADADLSAAGMLALGGTGADCERWVRGARRRARHGGRDMTVTDLLDEIRGTTRARSADQAYRYAIHEAGHALVLVVERPGALVCASIRRSADGQGAVVANREGRETVTRKEIAGDLRMLLGGRAAEDVVFGDASTGAGGGADSDLAKATMAAASALYAYGLDDGEDALLWRGLPTPDALAATLAVRPDLAKRIAALLAEAYADTMTLIQRRRQDLEAIARLLVERETVEGQEIEALVRGTISVGVVGGSP